MKGKSAIFRRLLMLAAFFALIAFIVIYCRDSIRQSYENELSSNIKLVTENNARILEEELNGRQRLLRSIAAAAGRSYETTGSIEITMEQLSTLNEIHGFKRIVFLDRKGMGYSTDGCTEDMSYRDFFKRSMAGEAVITERFMDSMGTERDYINAFSVPVRRGGAEGGEIVGVIAIAYRNKTFQDRLNMDLFSRYGNVVIVDSTGGLVSARESVTVSTYGQNLFVIISAGGEVNAPEVALMREDLKAGHTGMRHFQGNGGQYVYYRPLGLDAEGQTWYIVTIVPEQTMVKELDMVFGNIGWMLLGVLGLLALVLVLLFYDTHRQWSMQERQLKQYAYEDDLTGGDNYNCFKEKLQKITVKGFIIAFDLRNFKIINAAYGTQTGDAVLQAVAGRLAAMLQKDEFMGHLNGDQFVIFCLGESEEGISVRLDRLTRQLEQLSEEMDIPMLVPYYGVTHWYPATEELHKEIEAAYSEASSVKNELKQRGEGNIGFFRQTDTERLLGEREMENAFQAALDKHEFEVWYQPKFNPANGKITGAEALVRWRRAGGLVPPGRFIPLFERNGQIAQLDEYVFKEVCRLQKVRTTMRQRVVPISVNISRTSLYTRNVVERYLSIVKPLELDLRYIPLEITESAAVNDEAIKGVAFDFSHAGFQLHLDDFGSGYSSLASLNTMHFNELKLDKSLIDFIGNYRGDRLLEHTIALAKELGIHVTAEGVEENRQAVALQRMGCDSIQGYYFSKPLPLMDFVQRLDAQVGIRMSEARKQQQVANIKREKIRGVMAGEVFTPELMDRMVGAVVCYRVKGQEIEITHANEAYCELMGGRLNPDGTLEQLPTSELHPDDQAGFIDCFARAAAYSSQMTEHELRIVHSDGRVNWVLLTMYYLRETAEGQEFCSAMKDVTAKHVHEQAIVAMTEVDPLLGIYNRHQVEKLVRRYMVENSDETVALILLDIDDFKQINDTLGRSIGDRILKETAYRVQSHFHDQIIFGRYGGDQLLLLYKHAGGSNLRQELEAFTSAMGYDYTTGEGSIRVTISLGCAIYPWHGMDFDDLFERAAMAVFAAKIRGKNRIEIFDEDIRSLAGERFQMNLHEVLAGLPGGFFIYRANAQGTLLYANERLMAMFGCSNIVELRELIGNSFFGMMPEEQRDRVQAEIERQIAGDGRHLEDYVEYDIRRRDGTLQRVADYGHLVHSQMDGDLFYVFISAMNGEGPAEQA